MHHGANVKGVKSLTGSNPVLSASCLPCRITGSTLISEVSQCRFESYCGSLAMFNAYKSFLCAHIRAKTELVIA